MHSVAKGTQTVATDYNGWCNRETWVVNLWLTSDECYCHELYGIIRKFNSIDEPAEELEQYVRWLVDTDERIGIAGDLLTTSLGRVNWHEIVEVNQE